MDAQQLSAVLLIAGFAVLVLGLPFGVPGLYQATDPAERVQLIEQHKTRFKVTQVSLALGFLLTTVGFVVLASELRKVGNAWIPTLGAAALVVGVISGEYFIYRQTTDPLRAYSGQYSGFETLSYWLWLAGLLLFGVASLQAGLPAWLGYLAAGAALIYGVIFLVTGSGFLTPGFVALFGLATAIVLFWQKPLP
ncbi:MAG: hypothetical protein ACE5JF_13635 [Anaerolineales bacterium]